MASLESVFNHAIVSFYQRDYEAAQRDLEIVLSKDEEHAQAYQWLGAVYHSIHDYDNALHHYKQAVKIKTKYPLAYYRMGTLFMDRGALASAKDALSLAHSQDPKNQDILHKLIQLSCLRKDVADTKMNISRIEHAGAHPDKCKRYVKYANYLTQHKAIMFLNDETQMWLPITGQQFERELCMINGTTIELQTTARIIQHNSGKVLLEIGGGNGIFTALFSQKKIFDTIIPLDFRPTAVSCYEQIKSHNDGALIKLDWIRDAAGDGKCHLLAFPESDLAVPPIPNDTYGIKSRTIDSLELESLSCLISHWHTTAIAILEGAKETLAQHKPNCLFLIHRDSRASFANEMKQHGYALHAAHYADNREMIYCFFEPSSGSAISGRV